VYLYPTQGGRLNFVTNVLGAVWAVALVAAIVRLPSERPTTADPLTLASLAFRLTTWRRRPW